MPAMADLRQKSDFANVLEETELIGVEKSKLLKFENACMVLRDTIQLACAKCVSYDKYRLQFLIVILP